MKKQILIMSTAFLLVLTSCSSGSNSSAPEVKNEIYGSVTTESETVAEHKKENVTLTYAVYGQVDSEEYELIKRFNEADNGYIIITKNYSEYVSPEADGSIIYDEDKFRNLSMALMQDIAEGEIDIVRDRYISPNQTMDRLSAQGAFADIYEFMENDADVNRSSLNSHILELHETDGKLYTLPTYFTFETLIGESRYVGDKEDWTPDDMISHWEQMPDGAMIDGHTEKNYVYMNILRGAVDSFIDYKNATVSFDSPEFKKILEFCNTFDNIPSYWSEHENNAVNFVSDKRFYGFANTHEALWNENNEPYTFVGYPSDNGSGGFIDTRGDRFAICALSSKEKQEGAWEFIRTFCMDDYQTAHYCEIQTMMVDDKIMDVYLEPVGFPMNLKVYDQLSKDAMAGKHMDSTISRSGVQYNIGQLTQEELDRLTAYINRIQKLSVSIDNDLYEIIEDEIYKYFNGEQTVQECVDIIQNRAEIMVSEKQ